MGFFTRQRVKQGKVVCTSRSYNFNIVGESRYQDVLRNIAGGHNRHGHFLETQAVLVCEPTNRFDPDAIFVEIDGNKVGYVPDEQAHRLSTFMREQGVQKARVDATITGGWRTNQYDSGHFGVKLRINATGWVDFGVGAQEPPRAPTRSSSTRSGTQNQPSLVNPKTTPQAEPEERNTRVNSPADAPANIPIWIVDDTTNRNSAEEGATVPALPIAQRETPTHVSAGDSRTPVESLEGHINTPENTQEANTPQQLPVEAPSNKIIAAIKFWMSILALVIFVPNVLVSAMTPFLIHGETNNTTDVNIIYVYMVFIVVTAVFSIPVFYAVRHLRNRRKQNRRR